MDDMNVLAEWLYSLNGYLETLTLYVQNIDIAHLLSFLAFTKMINLSGMNIYNTFYEKSSGSNAINNLLQHSDPHSHVYALWS